MPADLRSRTQKEIIGQQNSLRKSTIPSAKISGKKILPADNAAERRKKLLDSKTFCENLRNHLRKSAVKKILPADNAAERRKKLLASKTYCEIQRIHLRNSAVKNIAFRKRSGAQKKIKGQQNSLRKSAIPSAKISGKKNRPHKTQTNKKINSRKVELFVKISDTIFRNLR